MPRYLGINYFEKALAQRREFYNRSLLLIPKTLESSGYPVPSVKLQSLFERINTTYIDDNDELTRHENKLKNFLDIQVSLNFDKLESSYDTRRNDFEGDDVEVIPSSNPDSPEFLLTEAEIKLEKDRESFEKENLQDMDTLYEKYMLEDVIGINLKYKTKMPTVDQLCSKLQPKHVKDPLCDGHGEVYTEEKIFGYHTNLSEEFHGEAIQEPEAFDKVTVSEENENNLEEILSPKIHQPKDMIDINYQTILENSQPDTQSPIKVPSEIYDELSKTDVRTKGILERGIFDWKSETKNKEFTELNDDGNTCRHLEEEFIESPLACRELISYDKSFAADICEKVEYFAMPLLKTKKLLLRDEEEHFLFRAFWEKEKYYDEDLYIRFQVVERTKDQLHTNVMMAKLICSDIPCEKGLGECELKLTWDPFPKTLQSEITTERLTDKKNPAITIIPLSIESYEEKFNIKKEDKDEVQSENRQKEKSNILSPSPVAVHPANSRKRLQPFSSSHQDELSENKKEESSEWKDYSPSKNISAHDKTLFVKDVDLSPSLSPLSPSENQIYLTSVNNRHMQLSSHCITKSGTELSVPNHSDIGRLSQSNTPSDELTSPEKKKKRQEQSLNVETNASDTMLNTSQKNQINNMLSIDLTQENVKASKSRRTHLSDKGESISMETNDSLGLFLTMMASNVIEQQTNVNGICKEKEGKNMNSDARPSTCVPLNSQPDNTEVANKIIHVQFSGPFEEIYSEMESYIQPYINLLMQENELPKTFDFKSVTTDDTRFWLKQKEKLLIDEGRCARTDVIDFWDFPKDKDRDVCKWLMILHCMKIASKELLHSCLQSAISHLNSLQDKNSEILGSCFNDLRQSLFHHQYRYQTNQTIHPKILAVCREATGLLHSKKAEKWLLVVVLKKPVLSLMTILKDTLAVEGLIRPYIVSENDLWVNLRESGNNCFIVSQNKLKDIDLSDVACLFEYESSPESIIRGICESQAIGFIGFTVKDTQSQLINNNSINSTASHQDKSKHYQPITVIGSTNLTQHRNILQLLESKYNISVVERDYSAIKTGSPSLFADIILDQSNAIILKDIQYVTEESNIEPVTRQLAAFHLKYQKCWLILSTFETTNGYPLSSEVLSNLFKLEAALANITHKTKLDMAFKVLLCHQKEDMCCMVRAICDMICENTLHENLERPWLSQSMSKDEKLLLHLPCLNSYSSQLLLKKACLKEIMTMSLEDLHRTFPEVPYKVLEACHKVFTDDHGLHLQPSLTRSLHNKTENGFIKNSFDNEDPCSQSEAQPPAPKNTNILDSEAITRRQKTRSNFINPSIHAKHMFEDNFYSGQLLRNKSASEDFLTDHSNFCTSKDIDDQPNQYIVAELEGRQFYNRMSNIPMNEKSSSVDELNSDCQDYEYHPVTTALKPSIYACYSEPELRNLQTQLDKNPFTTDNNNFNKLNSSRPFYAQVPRKRLETMERSRPFSRLSQTWSNLSKYGQSGQLIPEKRSPSKTCIPVECTQTVKRLQERNAIEISGVSIRDKIQLYENQSNRRGSDVKSQYSNLSASSSAGKMARFSADLTSTTRNLLRRPILHETLQHPPIHPNLQKVSIGLAQPYRRVQNAKGPDSSWTNKEHDAKSHISSSSESHSYDQTPNNKRSKFPHTCDCSQFNKTQTQSHNASNRATDFSMNLNNGDQTISSSRCNFAGFPQTPHGPDASVHISGESSKQNRKPNKLSFRSIPGQKGGQTVLSFD